VQWLTTRTEEVAVSRFRASLALAAVLPLLVVGASGAQASDGPLPAPVNLRAVDVQPEGVTVTWDLVADAEEYSVRVIALEGLCGGGHRTTVTAGHTATFTGLTWDCPYSISVRARDLSAYPWRISDYARVQFKTPLPDFYEFPGSPSNLRAERDAAGNLTGFAWDGATAGVSPLGYRGYVEFDVITELSGQFFSTNEATTFFRDDPSWPMDNFDYFRDMAELEPGQTMRVWVTTADRINNESPPSNELILTCCPL
jgi:hypothetical protein